MSDAVQAVWQELKALPQPDLKTLFGDSARLAKWSAKLDLAGGAVRFDWSKTHLDSAFGAAFLKLADATGFTKRRAAMFAGEHINETEDRAVTHRAARSGQGFERRGSARAAHADEKLSRGYPSGRAGRGQAPDPHRHRRIGTRPGAGSRCADPRRGRGGRSCSLEHRRLRARSRVSGLRSCHHDDRGRLQNLHHYIDDHKCAVCAGMAASGRGQRSLWPGNRADRLSRQGGRMGGG